MWASCWLLLCDGFSQHGRVVVNNSGSVATTLEKQRWNEAKVDIRCWHEEGSSLKLSC